MSKLRQSEQSQSASPSPAQGKNPAMGESNSHAQEQLPEEQGVGAGASLLDEQDAIVSAFGTALEVCASSAIALATIAPGGHLPMGAIHPVRHPVAELLIALMAEGVAPERASRLANSLGGALARWFEGITPGDAFVVAAPDPNVTTASPLPLTYGMWTDALPFLPQVELMMFDSSNPQAATTVGTALANRFANWKRSTILMMNGVGLPGAAVQVLPPMTMTGGVWI